MKYESIDVNATDDNKVINLANCGDCNYTGNKGMWKGRRSINGIMTNFEGVVELRSDDEWDLRPIIIPKNNENIDGSNSIKVTGNTNCPICGGNNLY